MLSDLTTLPFESTFVNALPGDHSRLLQPRNVPGVCYSLVTPTPVSNPKLLGWSSVLGESMGIRRPEVDSEAVRVLGGNALAPGMQPYAARYGGHQFGVWARQLGDGRAITLGEYFDPNGVRQELQLKGAGPTPYSRRADGRAVLRSSVREFLCSEAMHHLGVPTTRALSLVGTGEDVVRDMFYDGRPAAEPGAVVCRVAPSFLRFGNFEIHASFQEQAALSALGGYLLKHHFPELGDPTPEAYAAMFSVVCRRTAVMVADWMRVGFVHGVMNTDNMSVLGLTIDYGPYGWLEGYDHQWTPNTTDAATKRYAFGQQPQICYWNLARFAESLLPLVGDEALVEHGLAAFRQEFQAHFLAMYAQKLGLSNLEQEGDDRLLEDLFSVLHQTETDMTLFFRSLAQTQNSIRAGIVDPSQLAAPLDSAYYETPSADSAARTALAEWLARYAKRSLADCAPLGDPIAVMNLANPKFVLRNYMAHGAITAAQEGDVSQIDRLLQVLSSPYDDQPEHEQLAEKRPEWARHQPGCSALSCSS